MLNFITGVPGSGKTAFAINEMLQLVKNGQRPIFVHGIPELKLTHEIIVCDSSNCDVCPALPNSDSYLKANEWHLWAPDGAVIFIDEVQTVYRPRHSSAAVSDNLAAFEKHRHRGLDFYLVSQHPRLVDSNLRALVSRHVHLTANWARRKAHEWNECKDNVQATSDAITSTYTIPKKIFKLYKSASLHTKVDRKIPPAVYVFIIGVLLFLYLGYNFYQSHIATNPAERFLDQMSQASGKPLMSLQQTQTQAQPPSAKFDFVSTVPNHPEAAPAYAQIVQVKDFPRLVGCIKSEKHGCTCYTQQATQYLVSKYECEDYLNRPRFDPYKEPNRGNVNAAPVVRPSAPAPTPISQPANFIPPSPVAQPNQQPQPTQAYNGLPPTFVPSNQIFDQ